MSSPLDKAKAYEVAWRQVAPLFDVAGVYADIGYVYFIGEDDGGPVKIGIANDPIKRLRAMQTGNPRRLRLELVLVGDRNAEKMLHALWEPFAIVSAASKGKPDRAPRTEWFRADIRAELFPILETAASKQIEVLRLRKDVTIGVMEGIIRDAHKAHDFVAKKHDEVRLLSADGIGCITRKTRPAQ